MNRNRLFAFALLCALAPALGGCNLQTFKEFWDAGLSIGVRVYTGVVNALPATARAIDYACSATQTPVDPNTPPACKAKFSKVKTAWRSACANTAKLTDDVAGNYVAKIKADLESAAKAC